MSIKLREGYYRTVENNIIFGPIPFALHCWYPDSEDVITRNIIVVTGNEVYEPINMFASTDENRWGKLIDYNLFKTGEPDKFIVKDAADSLKEWNEKGYDRHSIHGDPMFIDPDNGDFRLKADSPALKLGFKNVSMTDFGVQT